MSVSVTPVSEKLVTVTVNGTTYEHEVPARRLLVHFLRDDLALAGTRRLRRRELRGVHHAFDGVAVELPCSRSRPTVPESRRSRGSREDELTPLQQSFSDHHALQCGYCTPGMLIARPPFSRRTRARPRRMSRSTLQGDICRCTGYWNIVEAVVAAGKGGA